MNAQEALLLCRYAKAAAPQQQMDAHTPEVWLDLLEDVPYEDAQAAMKAHLQANPYVSPSDIRKRARVLSNRRSGFPEGW